MTRFHNPFKIEHKQPKEVDQLVITNMNLATVHMKILT